MAQAISPVTGAALPLEYQWKPGQSGNPRGSSRERRFRDALLKEMARADREGGPALQAVVGDLVHRALSADNQTAHLYHRQIAEIIDGPLTSQDAGSQQNNIVILPATAAREEYLARLEEDRKQLTQGEDP